MNLQESPELQSFREEVRTFLADNLPPDIKQKMEMGQSLKKDDYQRWMKILAGRGWLATGWPEEHGGPGWTPAQRYIYDEEYGRHSCPRVLPFGVTMVGPVIIAFGNEEQKAEYLPKIANSDVWWCQGYSEPGAGSDLASLKTRAVKENGHYIVNGQKTWTTMAQYADWIFCLVRTSDEGKPQEGISFLLIDMKTPGITVKPIVTMDGGQEVNEVFLDDVKVPIENCIGDENKGWTIAKYLLGHERTGIAEVGKSRRQLQRVKDIAAAETIDGMPLIEDPAFREKIAEVEIELLALDATILRMVSAEGAGKPPGPEASLLKIKGVELQQAITELLLEAIGNYGSPYIREAMDHGWNEPPIGPEYAAPVAPHYFNWRKSSIYGGSNEVQRGIIAKMVLGL
jgi:alkylation response protein AidB-like acyl-CoA dehydrogenase